MGKFRLIVQEIVGRLKAFIFLPIFRVFRRMSGKSNIQSAACWLIGENQGECLQDNSYAFYMFCRQSYPERPIYLALKLESPLYRNELSNDPNVLKYGSIRHMRIFSAATHCFYSHTYRDLMYRRFFELFGRDKAMIYLHHGTFGFKTFDSFYYRNRNIMDLFTVGSELERGILTNWADVDEHRVRVTGYARTDNLLRGRHEIEKQILYMPTHRRHLDREANKEFLGIITSFLTHPELLKLLDEKGFTLKVFLHAHTQKTLSSNFELHPRIQILDYGRTNVKTLLRTSMLMITDYSSVCWDFLTLGKPVIFYRFDVDNYSALRGSYIDLDDESYGEIAQDEIRLLQLLSQYMKSGCKLKTGVAESIGAVLPSEDRSNCDRIYELVNDLGVEKANRSSS